MESFRIEALSFSYPGKQKAALDGISLSVAEGEFLTIFGRSGCGKTTLLRMLKPSLAPHGALRGRILFKGGPLEAVDARTACAKIAFVQQDPESGVVTDKVFHELAFGLENLGLKTAEIRTRVAEVASFFGIGDWFRRDVGTLSGGQKQLLNLASAMAMQPDVLILDEPTALLDPIAARNFLEAVKRVNRELGTTVILSEHRLEEALPMSDRAAAMDDGRILFCAPPEELAAYSVSAAMPEADGTGASEAKSTLSAFLPVPARIFAALTPEEGDKDAANDKDKDKDADKNGNRLPLTVREGRRRLEAFVRTHPVFYDQIPAAPVLPDAAAVLELRDVWFRYAREAREVLRGVSIKARPGELLALVGENGAGKSTALSLLGGLLTPYRGKVLLCGSAFRQEDRRAVGMLPQHPAALFTEKSVFLDLCTMLPEENDEDRTLAVRRAAALCRVENVLDAHPNDLSGGELQCTALAKLLLKNPKVYLLDEPTKGMDVGLKERFAEILTALKARGAAIVMVSHDIEFCASHADRCAMLFDGEVTGEGSPRAFFAGNGFYTTAAGRMARNILPGVLLAEDVICACGGKTTRQKTPFDADCLLPPGSAGADKSCGTGKPENADKLQSAGARRLPPARIVCGISACALFAASCAALILGVRTPGRYFLMAAAMISVCCGLAAFFPQNRNRSFSCAPPGIRASRAGMLCGAGALAAAALTAYIGFFRFGNGYYYPTALLILAETMLPFFVLFERRRPKAREVVLLAALCAVCVAGRGAFYALPQFKPLAALVILSGAAFGCETGFLTGAMSIFLSNFFFGQGPWTPWQMLAFGLIGMVSGLLFGSGFLRPTRLSLSVYGVLSVFVFYGGLMDPVSILIVDRYLTVEKLIAAYASGVVFNVVHAAATAIFLWFLSGPMLEKFYRIRTKYGILAPHAE